jgi:hypothetical protein
MRLLEVVILYLESINISLAAPIGGGKRLMIRLRRIRLLICPHGIATGANVLTPKATVAMRINLAHVQHFRPLS